MATDLTIRVPDELRAAMEAAALAEGKTIYALMQEAAERFLDGKRRASLKERWSSLGHRGSERSASLGYTEDDVDRLIHEDREEQCGRPGYRNNYLGCNLG